MALVNQDSPSLWLLCWAVKGLQDVLAESNGALAVFNTFEPVPLL